MGTVETVYGIIDEIDRERMIQLANKYRIANQDMFIFFDKEEPKYNDDVEFMKAIESNEEFQTLNNKCNSIMSEIKKLVLY